MNVSARKSESPVLSATQGAVIGGAAAGVGKLGANIAKSQTIKGFYDTSINKQGVLLDQFKNSKTKDGAKKTIKEFIANKKATIEKTKDAGSIFNVHRKAIEQYQSGDTSAKGALDKFKSTFDDFKYSTKRQIESKLKDMEKVLKKGETSKSIATKETIAQTANKAIDKAIGLKNNLKEALNVKGFKGKMTGVKTTINNFVKETPVLKKVGKFALIGAGIGALVSGGMKLLSNKQEAKNEVHYEASKVLEEE